MIVRIALVGAAILGLATAVGYGMGAFASSAETKTPSASQNIYGQKAKPARKSTAKLMTQRKSKSKSKSRSAGAARPAAAATVVDSLHRPVRPDRSLSRDLIDMRRSFVDLRATSPFKEDNQGVNSRLLSAPIHRFNKQ
ncbi:MAG: hypothetical protein L0Y44_00020 [Phycisphaerales bacterium]|nr:hypothetical protein [Phycisphaerales bacterium]MCI0629023.1 hypothetical protein [Phycisphaerales bacterium]MCI0674780.1 hypothetical protein [Phycisphaerales bacterium]